MRLKMGTRGSALALAQSGQLAELLKKSRPDLEVETVIIQTSGDLFATQTPKEAYAMAEGTKGLFVKEIEEALIRGDIDFAVHSAKDLPGALAEGLGIAAYPRREDPRDVFIGRAGKTWKALKAGDKVATSSLRRKVQLLKAKPGLTILPLRGNVDTRLRKLSEGTFDGVVLALAGLRRLKRQDIRHEPISVADILPAPGQGALAVEVRGDRADILKCVGALDHAATRLEVEFERSLLQALGGGCSTPLGALAQAETGGMKLSAFWSREDGGGAIRLTETCADLKQRDAFTAALAEKIRRGG